MKAWIIDGYICWDDGEKWSYFRDGIWYPPIINLNKIVEVCEPWMVLE